MRDCFQILNCYLFSTVLGTGWKTTNYEDYFEDINDMSYSMMADTKPPNEEKQNGFVIEAVKNMEYVTDDSKDSTEKDSGFMDYMSYPPVKHESEVMRVKDQVEEVRTDVKNMKVDMKIMKGEAEMLIEDLNEMKRDKKKMMRVIAKMNGDMKSMRKKMGKVMKDMKEELNDMQNHRDTLGTEWSEGETKLLNQDVTGSWNFQS